MCRKFWTCNVLASGRREAPPHVVLLERRPIRSGRPVLRFVTDRKPTHAGIDPYNFYVDRNSADNVVAVR